jgi:hypothetical protein
MIISKECLNSSLLNTILHTEHRKVLVEQVENSVTSAKKDERASSEEAWPKSQMKLLGVLAVPVATNGRVNNLMKETTR